MTDPKELLEPTIIFGAQEHHPSGDPYAKGFKERDLGGDGGIGKRTLPCSSRLFAKG